LKGGTGAVRYDVFSTIEPRRTSKPEKIPHGFSEPTATIIWSTLLRLGMAADHFVLWNAFPWHSFDALSGMLSNRTPTNAELAAGAPAPPRERRWRVFSPADSVSLLSGLR
jgi:hypothetical protein